MEEWCDNLPALTTVKLGPPLGEFEDSVFADDLWAVDARDNEEQPDSPNTVCSDVTEHQECLECGEEEVLCSQPFRHCEVMVTVEGVPMFGLLCPLETLMNVGVSACGRWGWLEGDLAYPLASFEGGSLRLWLEEQYGGCQPPAAGDARWFVDVVRTSNTDVRLERYMRAGSHFRVHPPSLDFPVRDAACVGTPRSQWQGLRGMPGWCRGAWAGFSKAVRMEGLDNVVARVWRESCAAMPFRSDCHWPDVLLDGQRVHWSRFVPCSGVPCPVGSLVPVVLRDRPEQPLPWECFVQVWLIGHAYGVESECVWAVDATTE